jgi:Zn-dependent peptidase ImmA (M78 family)
MSLRVPFIDDETIEHDAEALLAEYARAKNVEIKAPIPIEDIVEKHLKLTVEFDDLHSLLGVPRGRGIKPHIFGLLGVPRRIKPDIFGAIWLETGKIVIDESLDPEERPSIEGRYRFTLAHEGGGHWRLHRPLVQAQNSERLLFGDTPRTTFVCRSSQAKERVELQADLYASCLLMPRKLVMQAWRDKFGNDNPRVLRRSISTLELFLRPLAKQFLVSPVAMRIRLEKLGLLYREARQPTLHIEQFLRSP